MDFSHSSSPYCFLNHQLYGINNKRTVVHFRSYGNRRRRFFRFIKLENQNLVCFFSIYRYSLLRTLLSLPEGFIELMQRGPRESESRYLQFILQRLGDLIYIPHLLAHAVLTLYTSSPTIVSGWEAATTTNQQNVIQTLDEYTFGVRPGRWREIFRNKG